MRSIFYFCSLFIVIFARPQNDQNLCKQQPDLPYCKVEDLEFHISRAEVAEPEIDPTVIPKKLIEHDDQSSSGGSAAPLLSNEERKLAIEDSKSPLSVLTNDIPSTPKPHHAKTRDKRQVDDSEEFDYRAYRRQRARIRHELNDLDSYQRQRSNSVKYYPSELSSPGYGGGGYNYPSSSGYGNPSYGYGGGYRKPFNFGIGSGLNILGFGVSSGLGVTVG